MSIRQMAEVTIGTEFCFSGASVISINKVLINHKRIIRYVDKEKCLIYN